MFLQVNDITQQLNKDIFKSWEVVKAEIISRDFNMTIDPIYYEFNNIKYIKLGDLNYNFNCHLEQLQEYQYKTELNIAADLNIPYYYPLDIINYYLKQQYISIELKLRYPHDLKEVFDSNNHYNDFYIDFYQKHNINNIYISCTERDNLLQTNIDVEPMQKWYTYVYNIVKEENNGSN